MVACGGGPSQCPTVPEESETGFDMEFGVQWDIEHAVKDLLNDPDSYKKNEITASRRFEEARDDGSRYYARITVDFRARNAFGGMVPGSAVVWIQETPEEGCVVNYAELQ